MKSLQALSLGFVLLAVLLNVALKVSSQHLNCEVDDEIKPDCPINEINASYYPVPYDCRKFLECYNGTVKCLRCAPGTVWNQEETVCVHEDSIPCIIVTTTIRPRP